MSSNSPSVSLGTYKLTQNVLWTFVMQLGVCHYWLETLCFAEQQGSECVLRCGDEVV